MVVYIKHSLVHTKENEVNVQIFLDIIIQLVAVQLASNC